MKRVHTRSDFDGCLREEGLLAECEAGALKRVAAWQLEQEMKRCKLTLQFLEQAALALDRKLKLKLA